MAGAYKTVSQTTTIEAALNDAASELVSLRDEMTEWRDNMEEKLSHTEKYETVSAACDALDEADGLDDKAGAILEKLELLADGREEVKPCVEHVIGTACAVCGWNGEGQQNPKARVDIRETPSPLGSDFGLSIVGRRAGICFCFPNGKPRERKDSHFGIELFPSEAEARDALKKLAEGLATKHPPVAPPLRKAVTPLAPLPSAKGLANTEIRVLQSEPTRKGRGTSRSTRLGNATAMAQAAIEALRLALEDLEPEEGSEQNAIVEEIHEELNDYESVIENCESVEFPGMFG